MTRPTRDATLVAAARKGGRAGRAAFGELVEIHREWLVRLLTPLVGSGRAPDVAQDAFLRAFMAIDRCRDGAGFRAWLRVIATRLAYNAVRDSRTRSRYHTQYQRAPSAAPMPADIRVAEGGALLAALEQLSYPYREILVLRYVEELSVKEIARSLDIGLSAAKMRLLRAREELKRHYELGGEN